LYLPERTQIVKDTKDEKNTSEGDVLTTFYLSIPKFNQTGTRIIAPPNPKAPPTKPAAKPDKIDLHNFFSFILSF
jgi:hypothetical protein